MTLALFDLDNTLLAGDSDHSWGEFLVSQGVVDADHYQQMNDQFYQDYRQGCLDIYAYLDFALAPLAALDTAHLQQLHHTFMNTVVAPMLQPKAIALVDDHHQKGHTTIIITATNRFVVEPIAEKFATDALIATEPEKRNGQYTGKITGEPNFQVGKVTNLQRWMSDHQHNLTGSYFYSDSINDLPLLEQVDHPVAVDPCPALADTAKRRGWDIISLRD